MMTRRTQRKSRRLCQYFISGPPSRVSNHAPKNLKNQIPDYISRLRGKATPCKFIPEELNDRLIEMVILLTPMEDFRKDLLTKDKTYTTAQTIELRLQYEVVIPSQT